MEEEKKRPYVMKGDKEFKDERGKISNFHPTRPIEWIGLITSHKGTTRANHMHPVQEQNCLVISGGYASVWRDEEGNMHDHLVKAGDLEIMPAKIDHVMVFIEETVFLNLVESEREHENFNKEEGHTLRLEKPVVAPENTELINQYIERYKDLI